VARSVASSKATLIGIPAPLVVKPGARKDEPAADEKPADEKPADEKPADSKSADEKPADASTAPTKAADATPTATSTDMKGTSASLAEPSHEPKDSETTKPDRPSVRTDKPVTRSAATVSSRPSAADSSTTTRNLLLVSLVLAAAILGGRYYLEQKTADVPPPPAADALPAANQPPEPQAVPAAPPAEALAPAALPAETAAPDVSAAPPTPADSAAPPTSALASAAPAPSASPPAEGTRVVVVKISPPQAKLWRKGKAVGSSPVTIELAPGEKRAYEVGMPGWVTRRLVVDGSKPEIFIGLKPSE
jgi:hypothetical protein